MAVLWDVVSGPVFTVTQQFHNSRLACLPEGDMCVSGSLE